MSKAIAVHAVFLIGVISIFLFFVVGILFIWIDTSKLATSFASCTQKRLSYCTDWSLSGNKPDWWGTKDPKGCESSDINIPEPTCPQCRDLTKANLKC